MDWKVSNRSGTFIARGAAGSWNEARKEAMERPIAYLPVH